MNGNKVQRKKEQKVQVCVTCWIYLQLGRNNNGNAETSPAAMFLGVSVITASRNILDARNYVSQIFPYILLLDHNFTQSLRQSRVTLYPETSGRQGTNSEVHVC